MNVSEELWLKAVRFIILCRLFVMKWMVDYILMVNCSSLYMLRDIIV